MKIVHRDHVVYSMSKNNIPVMTIEPGEQVTFQTFDCFSGQISHKTDLFEKIGWDRINPATGPVSVKGAEPGDMLGVRILDIRVASQGVMVTVPGMGALGSHFQVSTTNVIPIESGVAVLDNDLRIPIDPMIGVIGTAPDQEEISCGTPGPHGGNMDCKKIRKGATVYLPVFVSDGLLAMGDLHAVMGDGEVLICGVEISGEVDVEIELIKNCNWPLPMLEDENHWITIASKNTLDEAAVLATENMAAWLQKESNYSIEKAGMLMSAVGNLRICQIVDPLLTARFEIPKKYLTK